MTYKEKYFKLFLRFIKEINLTKIIDQDTIYGRYGLNNIFKTTAPNLLALNFFSKSILDEDESIFMNNIIYIGNWETVIMEEFKKDLLQYIKTNKDRLSQIFTVTITSILKCNTISYNDFNILIIETITKKIFNINDFYNSIII